MWHWIGQNSGALTVLINAGMLLVWSVYLHLFLAGYRRERRSSILIGCGAGGGHEARCLVCNMSREPVYVLDVIAAVRLPEGSWKGSIADYETDGTEPPRDISRRTRQGPLHVGEMRDFGRFEAVLERARDAPGELDRAQACGRGASSEIELTVVAGYGPEDLPVAARRTFLMEGDPEAPRVTPRSLDTEQVRGKRARRRLHEHMKDFL